MNAWVKIMTQQGMITVTKSLIIKNVGNSMEVRNNTNKETRNIVAATETRREIMTGEKTEITGDTMTMKTIMATKCDIF